MCEKVYERILANNQDMAGGVTVKDCGGELVIEAGAWGWGVAEARIVIDKESRRVKSIVIDDGEERDVTTQLLGGSDGEG